jgi:hypothetical protein
MSFSSPALAAPAKLHTEDDYATPAVVLSADGLEGSTSPSALKTSWYTSRMRRTDFSQENFAACR